MIVFDLTCANGHAFEGWFESHTDFEAKRAGRAIACPDCGDVEVTKMLSAPRVNRAAAERPPAPCGVPVCGRCGCGAMPQD